MNAAMGSALAFFAIVWVALRLYKGNRARAKGYLGENLLEVYLKKHLDPADYTVLHDVMLPLEDGTTTQIDHLVVSRWGIFVVETKTYRGWIFGDAKSPVWTVTHGRRPFKFQNPLRQNFLHVKALARCLGFPETVFHSIVAFSGEATFKTDLSPDVTRFGNLPDLIRSRSTVVRIPAERLPEVLDAIREWDASVMPEQRKRHVANLRKRHPRPRSGARSASG